LRACRSQFSGGCPAGTVGAEVRNPSLWFALRVLRFALRAPPADGCGSSAFGTRRWLRLGCVRHPPMVPAWGGGSLRADVGAKRSGPPNCTDPTCLTPNFASPLDRARTSIGRSPRASEPASSVAPISRTANRPARVTEVPAQRGGAPPAECYCCTLLAVRRLNHGKSDHNDPTAPCARPRQLLLRCFSRAGPVTVTEVALELRILALPGTGQLLLGRFSPPGVGDGG
jgi:hypothetical protein